MKKLSILLFSLLITGITCIHAQTDIKSNNELITIKVETDKSFGEHVQKSYSNSKNNGFNFNKTNNYGSYKKANNCLSQKRIELFHNNHVIETDNSNNRLLFEFISKEGDTMILNKESGDYVWVSDDINFIDKKNMEFITDDGKTIKIMHKTE